MGDVVGEVQDSRFGGCAGIYECGVRVEQCHLGDERTCLL